MAKFVDEIKVKLSSFQDEFGNETKNRVYIETFMIHAVNYIWTQINESVRLKLIENLLLLCKVKAEDMNQGSAQVIVQAQSEIEQLSKLGHEELLIYGIASTGKLWWFIHWSVSSKNPEVRISFKGELADEKEILTYIAQILTSQVYFYSTKQVKVNEKWIFSIYSL